jgi:hypothetical protein
MPSGEIRHIAMVCYATVGQVGNIDHENVSIGKAGRNRWLGWRPHNRGVVMNPVDHPHGGGEGKTGISATVVHANHAGRLIQNPATGEDDAVDVPLALVIHLRCENPFVTAAHDPAGVGFRPGDARDERHGNCATRQAQEMSARNPHEPLPFYSPMPVIGNCDIATAIVSTA